MTEDEIRELQAHVNDASRMLHTPGGRVSPTTVRGLLAGLRAFARQEQQAKALVEEGVRNAGVDNICTYGESLREMVGVSAAAHGSEDEEEDDDNNDDDEDGLHGPRVAGLSDTPG